MRLNICDMTTDIKNVKEKWKKRGGQEMRVDGNISMLRDTPDKRVEERKCHCNIEYIHCSWISEFPLWQILL